MQIPKIKPYRNDKYLKFIRSKPCLRCRFYGQPDNPIVAAHQSFGQKGTATKPPDIWAVPLHAKCHTGENGSEHQIGNKTFWQGYNLELECLKLINEYLTNI